MHRGGDEGDAGREPKGLERRRAARGRVQRLTACDGKRDGGRRECDSERGRAGGTAQRGIGRARAPRRARHAAIGNRGHRSRSSATGIDARSRVPFPPVLSSTRPPSASTRRRTPRRPEPDASAPPTPSSATSSTTSPLDAREPHRDAAGARVLGHVGERLGTHEAQRGLDVGRQLELLQRELGRDRQGAGAGLERGAQPAGKRGGPQALGEPQHVDTSALEIRARRLGALHPLDRRADRVELGQRAALELRRKAAALRSRRVDQPRPRRRQLVDLRAHVRPQADAVDGDAGGCRDGGRELGIVEHGRVVDERPHRLARVAQRGHDALAEPGIEVGGPPGIVDEPAAGHPVRDGQAGVAERIAKAPAERRAAGRRPELDHEPLDPRAPQPGRQRGGRADHHEPVDVGHGGAGSDPRELERRARRRHRGYCRRDGRAHAAARPLRPARPQRRGGAGRRHQQRQADRHARRPGERGHQPGQPRERRRDLSAAPSQPPVRIGERRMHERAAMRCEQRRDAGHEGWRRATGRRRPRGARHSGRAAAAAVRSPHPGRARRRRSRRGPRSCRQCLRERRACEAVLGDEAASAGARHAAPVGRPVADRDQQHDWRVG